MTFLQMYFCRGKTTDTKSKYQYVVSSALRLNVIINVDTEFETQYLNKSKIQLL